MAYTCADACNEVREARDRALKEVYTIMDPVIEGYYLNDEHFNRALALRSNSVKRIQDAAFERQKALVAEYYHVE